MQSMQIIHIRLIHVFGPRKQGGRHTRKEPTGSPKLKTERPGVFGPCPCPLLLSSPMGITIS
jgi:hypothetical protein